MPGRPRSPTMTICNGFVEQFGVVEQSREREEIARDLAGKGLDDRLGAAAIGFFAGQDREPGQHPDQGAVAGRDGGIGGGFGARDQPLGVVGGKEIAARRLVPIMAIEDRRPSRGPASEARRRRSLRAAPARRGRDWHNRRRSPDAGPGRRASCASSRPSAPVMCRRMKSKARARELDPVRPLEDEPGIGHRRDHQPVPVGEHLVVEPGPHPRLARPEQQRAAARQLALGLRHRRVPACFDRLRMVLPFPIALPASRRRSA